jgi:hypothetical protein
MSKLQVEARLALGVLEAYAEGRGVSRETVMTTIKSLREAINEPIPCKCDSPKLCDLYDCCIKANPSIQNS